MCVEYIILNNLSLPPAACTGIIIRVLPLPLTPIIKFFFYFALPLFFLTLICRRSTIKIFVYLTDEPVVCVVVVCGDDVKLQLSVR